MNDNILSMMLSAIPIALVDTLCEMGVSPDYNNEVIRIWNNAFVAYNLPFRMEFDFSISHTN
jgi:hypothetical protein